MPERQHCDSGVPSARVKTGHVVLNQGYGEASDGVQQTACEPALPPDKRQVTYSSPIAIPAVTVVAIVTAVFEAEEEAQCFSCEKSRFPLQQ